MSGYNGIEMGLLNNFQHAFPLVSRPFEAIGRRMGLAEGEVIRHFEKLAEDGAISRIGPVFSPNCIGVSTLAALAVPAALVDECAAWLNTLPQINHNYEREHDYNLWFVAAAQDQAQLDAVLELIATRTACPMLVLPLEERFHIDLGFNLVDKGGHAQQTAGLDARVKLNVVQSGIVAALQSGIKLTPEPFAAIGTDPALHEDEVINQIVLWRMRGVIKRFGVVVRHRELGYRDNAMVVWDVPDERVSSLGMLAAQQEGVTLCYRRPRRLPGWTYNLFCMVHGTDRDTVRRQIDRIAKGAGLDAYSSQTLFSRRRFKQCGAQYVTGDFHG